jgi:hypothetical protein
LDWTNDENYPVGIIDVTDFFVNSFWQPWNLWSWKHRKTVLKYEIVLHMNRDLIIWCSGPWTGRTNDQGIFNSQLKNVLKKNERLVSDSGYNGEHFIKSIDKKKLGRNLNEQEKIFNWERTSISARIENLNERFKKFNCLRSSWRHGILKHKIAFYIILNLCQIKLQIQPLRKNKKRIIN